MPIDADMLKGQALRAVKAFSPAQLVIAGLLGVVAIVGASTFFSWISAPSYTVLYAGLAAKDAAAVTTKLQSAGVPFKLTSGGTTVMVPSDKVDAERVALSAAGVVKGGTVGYELLDQQSLTTSSFTQQIDMQRAMEGELDRSLQTISGINSAQVHLVLPQERLFSDQQQPARASVLLDTNGTLSHDQVQAIISLVSSSVQSLDPSAVTVTDSNGRLLSSIGGSNADTQIQQRQAYEDTLTASTQTMLDQLVGPGHSVVRVSADMDFAKHTIDSVTYDATKSTPLTNSSTVETFNGGASRTSGGALTVTNTNPSSIGPGQAGTNYSKKTSDTSFGVAQTNDHGEATGGKIARLSVAVAVDANAKGLPPTAQLQSLIAAAVGLDSKRGDAIVVTATSFSQASSATMTKGTKSAGAATAGMLSGGLAKTASTTVAALMLLVITLFVARSVRRPKVTELDVSSSFPALPPGSIPRQLMPAGTRLALPGDAAQLTASAGVSDLLGAIEHSSDEVTSLLRNWLADSGPRR